VQGFLYTLRRAFFAKSAIFLGEGKMLRQEENFVALFIDWDNLAISTAVDFAGAVPDVRAIVKAAQRFGTVLLARAYAEWNVSSERLSVYRAGVEPVYAPTFRFEAEPSGSGSRGKSLADPCLVTDCIDTLHIMPEINVFVLVSGDKDMIPIVRLAQLRGKRVAVIGPDFAAAILREMADEYIPYRQLAEASDNPPTEVSTHGARGHRRVAQPNRLSPAPVTSSTRAQSHSRAAPLASAPIPPAPEANGADHRDEAVQELETVAEAPMTEPHLDTAPLFATIADILREREQAGKPRLRATNLKDQLLARISGFNERKYGFARFKDVLSAAERAGVLSVTRTGPVQWVTGISQTATSAPAGPEPTPATADTPTPTAESAEMPSPATNEAVDVDADVVRFVLGLRERSRWLTYTYVLTNLLNHLGNGAADAASDAEARTTLNRLVQAGVLVVDREPREIDVNGTRHRVRLCHVVDEHPLVQRAMREIPAVTEELAPSAEDVTPTETSAPLAEERQTDEPSLEPLSPVIDVVDMASPLATLPTAEEAPAEPADGQALAPETESAEAAKDLEPAVAEVEAPATAPGVDQVAELPEAPAEVVVEAPAPSVDGENGDGSNDGEPTASAPLTLAESFAILQEVVRDATDANRPTTGPAAIKNRLVRRLGAFDERAFGFSKFKDYLLSAQRAGAIRLEVSGNTTRVSLAAEPEAAAES
jgi:hypothetical protein